MTPTELRYDEHHDRIVELKEAVGENFWALGEELMRMQRECRECGHVPLGDDFQGNQRKGACPRCKKSALVLYKIHHKRFSDYLKHVGIHRQTAYRKIAVYETYSPLVPLISQHAPPDLWEDDEAHETAASVELRHAWARRSMSRIGWTILESVQKRVAEEPDEAQIMRIIEEAAESGRETLRAQKQTPPQYPHQQRVKSLYASLKELERCLSEAQYAPAREWLRAIANEASRLAVLIESEQLDVEGESEVEAVG